MSARLFVFVLVAALVLVDSVDFADARIEPDPSLRNRVETVWILTVCRRTPALCPAQPEPHPVRQQGFDGGNGTPYLPNCGPSANGIVAYYAGSYYRCQYGPPVQGDPSIWHWHWIGWA